LAIDSQVEKGTTARWMMMGEDDLAAGGDRIYPIVGWEERGGETNVYSTGGEYLTTPEGWHSWGWRVGPAVEVDADHVYCSMGYDPGDGGGEKFTGVARYTRDGKPAPFAGGKGGYGLEINGDQHKKPTPLAVYGGEALGADPMGGRIVIVSTADMRQVREFPCPNPGRNAINATPKHALWECDTAANVVRRLGRNGERLETRITDCLEPVAMSFAPKGDLLVADGDPNRQPIQRLVFLRLVIPTGPRVTTRPAGK
jgi:hypothetical protein